MTNRQPLRDPARQPERTRLSWRRTVLAATVAALLALRLAVQRPTPVVSLLAGAAVCGAWLGLVLLGWRRNSHMTVAVPAAASWEMPLTTLTVVGLAGLGVVLVVVG